MKYLGECKCYKWGYAPETFNESKHFLKCPSCGQPMYLSHLRNGEQPQDIGLSDRNKVTITEFIFHRG